MPFTPDQLYQKLEADPLSLGLATYLAIPDYVTVTNLINSVGSTSTFLVANSQVTVDAFLGAFTESDLALVTADQFALINTAANGGFIDGTSTLWPSLLNVFSGYSSTTTASLANVGKRYGSAMEVWFGPGTVAQITDVEAAILAK